MRAGISKQGGPIPLARARRNSAATPLRRLGFSHNNCGGFCCKAGQGHFAHLLKVLPHVYAEHEAKEEAMRQMLDRDISILVDRRGGGRRRPLTLRQLRLRIETGSRSRAIMKSAVAVVLQKRTNLYLGATLLETHPAGLRIRSRPADKPRRILREPVNTATNSKTFLAASNTGAIGNLLATAGSLCGEECNSKLGDRSGLHILLQLGSFRDKSGHWRTPIPPATSRQRCSIQAANVEDGNYLEHFDPPSVHPGHRGLCRGYERHQTSDSRYFDACTDRIAQKSARLGSGNFAEAR